VLPGACGAPLVVLPGLVVLPTRVLAGCVVLVVLGALVVAGVLVVLGEPAGPPVLVVPVVMPPGEAGVAGVTPPVPVPVV